METNNFCKWSFTIVLFGKYWILRSNGSIFKQKITVILRLELPD